MFLEAVQSLCSGICETTGDTATAEDSCAAELDSVENGETASLSCTDRNDPGDDLQDEIEISASSGLYGLAPHSAAEDTAAAFSKR